MVIATAVDLLARSATGELRHRISALASSAIGIGDAIVTSLGQWAADLLSGTFFRAMVFLNPKLSPGQQSHLLRILSRAMENLIQEGSVDEQLMRSIITLASPDRGTCRLLTYLIEAFTAPPGGGRVFASKASNSPRSSCSSGIDLEEERRAAMAMIKQYGIHRAAVAAMPPEVRRAILKVLKTGSLDRGGGRKIGLSGRNRAQENHSLTSAPMDDRGGKESSSARDGSAGIRESDGSSKALDGKYSCSPPFERDDQVGSTVSRRGTENDGSDEENGSPPFDQVATVGDGPICCITLEPLLWPDCSVTPDVVAVIQRSQHRDGGEHAFLYRGSALLEWLGRRDVPVSPETRSIIKPGDIYRLS